MPPQASDPIINRCPECEGEIDVTELSPFSKITCPHCQEQIRVRTGLGTFHLTRLLGEGGMSQVFLATDTTLNREVALKVLHRNLTKNASLTAMFAREAKLTASVNHSNVVRVYTVGEDQGYFFIAMELVDNVSLEEKISGQGPVREAEVIEIAYDVSLGLRAAFQAGLIHRDIKPGNILLTKEGSAKLVDFGLALAHGGEDEMDEVWATPFYVPPEKLDGEPDDFRGDIYSLGAALFHALVGHPPFAANTASMQELKEIKAKPLHVRNAAPQASLRLAQLIDKMMSYHPSDRFQSYDELVKQIGTLLEASGSKGRRVVDRKRPDKTLSKLLAVGVPVVAVAIGAGVYFTNPGGGDIDPDMLPGGDERIIAVGANAGAVYQAARDELAAGKFDSARDGFQGLLDKESLKQPMRSWTRFNIALSVLLTGDERQARDLFAELAAENGYPEDDSAQAEKEFFETVGRLASQPLPVMERAHARFDETSMTSLGLLVCGLKNWHAGEFESGYTFLSRFAASKPPAGFEWIARCQGLVEPYTSDLGILQDLPRPERSLEPTELAAMQQQLTLALAALETDGAARAFTRSRLERARRFLAEPAPKPPTDVAVGPPPGGGDPAMTGGTPATSPPPAGSTGPEATEMAALEKLRAEAAPMLERYEFVAATGVWADNPFESQRARMSFEAEQSACQMAEQFLVNVTGWLSKGEFEGVVQRREGVPLDAAITDATRAAVIVDLGFGPNTLPVSELDPSWLLGVARDKVFNAPGFTAEENPEWWMQAAWFARQCGLHSEGAELATRVAPLSEVFNTHWRLVTTPVGGDGTTSGMPGGGGSIFFQPGTPPQE